jgi:glycosyltransferase involved in cell wall biosynthesis
MTVHNGALFVSTAIESILAQSYFDFEFIIIDDGSTDETHRILASYDDPRIRLFLSPHRGLTASLNHGLGECRGSFIARMDADDIAEPQRFARQLAFFEDRPDVDIICSDVTIINEEGQVSGVQSDGIINNDTLRQGLLYQRKMKPIIHPSVMMRRGVMRQLTGYRDIRYAEDHDLWLRAVDHFKFARINQPLLRYRVHAGGISRNKSTQQAVSTVMSAVNYMIFRKTNVDLFNEHKALFHAEENYVSQILESEILPIAMKFRKARLQMARGEKLQGSLALASLMLRCGFSALPSNTNSQISALIQVTAERAETRLQTA